MLLYTAGASQYSVGPEWRVNKDDGRHVENKGIIVSSENTFRILVGNFKTGGDVYLPFPEETLGISHSFGSFPQYHNHEKIDENINETFLSCRQGVCQEIVYICHELGR